MAQFTNQVAVVTGASSGIGRALALALANEGAKLCLLGRNTDRLCQVAQTAVATSHEPDIYPVDFNMVTNLQDSISSIQSRYKSISILIHCAGSFAMGNLETVPIDSLDSLYQVNVRTPYLLTQALLPKLRTNKGQIVFINSSVGLQARAGISQYAATKHALKAMADSLREEVNDQGIRVMSIYPGRTASPMQKAIHELENRSYSPHQLMQPEDIASTIIHALSLPRTAEVTDIRMRPFLH